MAIGTKKKKLFQLFNNRKGICRVKTHNWQNRNLGQISSLKIPDKRIFKNSFEKQKRFIKKVRIYQVKIYEKGKPQ